MSGKSFRNKGRVLYLPSCSPQGEILLVQFIDRPLQQNVQSLGVHSESASVSSSGKLKEPNLDHHTRENSIWSKVFSATIKAPDIPAYLKVRMILILCLTLGFITCRIFDSHWHIYLIFSTSLVSFSVISLVESYLNIRSQQSESGSHSQLQDDVRPTSPSASKPRKPKLSGEATKQRTPKGRRSPRTNDDAHDSSTPS